MKIKVVKILKFKIEHTKAGNTENAYFHMLYLLLNRKMLVQHRLMATPRYSECGYAVRRQLATLAHHHVWWFVCMANNNLSKE